MISVPRLPGQGGRNRRRREGDPAKREIRDDRVSTCKNCRLGIFAGQARHWSRDPIGLIHDTCPPQPVQRPATPNAGAPPVVPVIRD